MLHLLTHSKNSKNKRTSLYAKKMSSVMPVGLSHLNCVNVFFFVSCYGFILFFIFFGFYWVFIFYWVFYFIFLFFYFFIFFYFYTFCGATRARFGSTVIACSYYLLLLLSLLFFLFLFLLLLRRRPSAPASSSCCCVLQNVLVLDTVRYMCLFNQEATHNYWVICLGVHLPFYWVEYGFKYVL